MAVSLEKQLVLAAATHRWTPPDILSRLYVNQDEWYPKLCSRFQEVFIFQTCHRVEYYFYSDRPLEDSTVEATLEEIYQDNSLCKYFRIFRGEEAIRHILRVSAGLDSAILGECDVLGQLERAFDYAVRTRRVSLVLKTIVEQAIRFGKHVRTVTGISRGVTGFGSLTVHFLKKLYGDLSTVKILIVGAGEMGSSLAKELHDEGARQVIILNRTIEKARELAEKFGFSYDYLTPENLLKYLQEVDIAIFAVSTQEPILKKQDISRLARRPLIVDLGMPRNVEPGVDTAVITLDDLAKLAEKYNREKLEEAKKVEQMLEEELKRVVELANSKFVSKMLGNYMKFIEEVKMQEVEKAISRRVLKAEDREAVLLVISSILNKALRPLIKTIQAWASTRPEEAYRLLRDMLAVIEQEFHRTGYDENGSRR